MTSQSYSSSDLAAYAGEYRSDELNASFTISVLSGGQLAVVRHEYEPVPLRALARDSFFGDFSDGCGTLTFVRTSRGAITGFTEGRTPRRLSFAGSAAVPAAVR